MAVPPSGPGAGGPGQPPPRGVPGQVPGAPPPPPGVAPQYPQGIPGGMPPPGVNYPPAYPQQPGYPPAPYPPQPGFPQQAAFPPPQGFPQPGYPPPGMPPQPGFPQPGFPQQQQVYRPPFGVPQVPGGMPGAVPPQPLPPQPAPGMPPHYPPPGTGVPPGGPGYANMPRPGMPQSQSPVPPQPQSYGGGVMFPSLAPPPGGAMNLPPRPSNVPGGAAPAPNLPPANLPPRPTNVPPPPATPSPTTPAPAAKAAAPPPPAPRRNESNPSPPPSSKHPTPAAPNSAPNTPSPPVAPPAAKAPTPEPVARAPVAPKPVPPKQPAPAPVLSPAKPDATEAATVEKIGPGIVETRKPEDGEPEQPTDPWTEFKEQLRKNSIPWSTSFVVHLILIIALGMLTISANRSVRITLEASMSDTPGTKTAADVRAIDMSTPDPVQLSDNRPVFTPSTQVTLAVPVSPFGVGKVSAVKSISMPPALAGRGMKSSLLGEFGGTEASEDAVKSGLYWLKRHQMENGMWSLTGKGGASNNRYSKGAEKENYEAATAMALLAYLGGGHTHKAGDFTDVVHKAAYELVRRQDPSGNFYRSEMLEETMYTQAQCTMAVCELYGMTKDVAPDFITENQLSNAMLKRSCEMAIKFCLESQDPQAGGWRYRPRSGSDTSVTGWMVMALISARNAGFDVPKQNLDLISNYLDLAARGPGNSNFAGIPSATPGSGLPADFGSKYSYMPAEDFTPSMTAEGLLCRMYLGWSHDDPRLVTGANLLLDHLPQWKDRDVYFWYYATQTMFHMEGKFWKTWNMALRDMLTSRQEKVGTENGSWDPVDREGPDLWALNKKGGRLYVTCFSLYMLEVYYRHLPLYSDLKKQMEASTKKKAS